MTLVELDRRGRLLHPETRAEVPDDEVRELLRRSVVIDADTTDIVVWVHGWQSDIARARSSVTRLAEGIATTYAADPRRYPNLRSFRPQYIGVHWPSTSWPLGYWRIRDRAHAMTTNGYAEYVLAHLLGYLEDERRSPTRGSPALLRTAGGQYLHCIGHSFGGRLLAEAVRAAARPSPPVLALSGGESFEFEVDNLIVFQMAAPPEVFARELAPLLRSAPLRGPVTLTYSPHDRANCLFHMLAEGGWRGIGCVGADIPETGVRTVVLRPVEESYDAVDLSEPIINVDAGWLYRTRGFKIEGAHSAYWHRESMHLILSLAALSRVRG